MGQGESQRVKQMKSQYGEDLLVRLNEPFWKSVFHKPGVPAPTDWRGGSAEAPGVWINLLGMRLRLRNLLVFGAWGALFVFLAAWIFVYSQKVHDHEFGPGPVQGISTWGGP